MQVIEAPNVYRSLPITKPKIIFLAGSIEMGTAENWQDEIIKVIEDSPLNTVDTMILNPRRKKWDNAWEQSIKNPYFREQVEWELQAIENANLVIFYFDPATQSPITLMELGTFIKRSGRAIVCCPEGYWKKGNVEVFCDFMGIMLVDTKQELINFLKETSWK